MFLTVKKVLKDQSTGLTTIKTASIDVADVVSYRLFHKKDEHQNLEGDCTYVRMKNPETGDPYFIVVHEGPEHFEKRINSVLWLKKHAENLVSSPIPTSSETSSGSSA